MTTPGSAVPVTIDDAAVDVHGLTVGYGGTPVLHDVTFRVAFGRVTALLGSNGAGKTTLLSALVGRIPVMSGSVRVGGADVTGGSCHEIVRRGVGIVPADRGLVSGLSVRDNLRLRVKARRDVDEVLEIFPALVDLLGRRAGLLSGGEQQMLALGCAIAARPRLLLIDELSHGLAPVIVERLLPTVQRLAREGGMAVVLVEQHVRSALEVASDVHVLKRGRLVWSGTADEVRANPDRLTAVYLGGGPAA